MRLPPKEVDSLIRVQAVNEMAAIRTRVIERKIPDGFGLAIRCCKRKNGLAGKVAIEL